MPEVINDILGYDGLKVIQDSEKFNFSLDSTLLVNFINPSLKKEEILDALEITDLSFWRYIQEIKAFIYNFNLPYELIYDRRSERYILKEND